MLRTSPQDQFQGGTRKQYIILPPHENVCERTHSATGSNYDGRPLVGQSDMLEARLQCILSETTLKPLPLNSHWKLSSKSTPDHPWRALLSFLWGFKGQHWFFKDVSSQCFFPFLSPSLFNDSAPYVTEGQDLMLQRSIVAFKKWGRPSLPLPQNYPEQLSRRPEKREGPGRF